MSNAVLQGKQKSDSLQFLELQQKHLRCFIQAYSKDCVRPKHHFALHLQLLAEQAGGVFDCFPCERKNKTYKGVLSPMFKRLAGYERAVLLRWLEYDMQKFMELPSQKLTNPSKGQVEVLGHMWTIGKGISHDKGNIRSGKILLVSGQTAFQVEACLQRRSIQTCFRYILTCTQMNEFRKRCYIYIYTHIHFLTMLCTLQEFTISFHGASIGSPVSKRSFAMEQVECYLRHGAAGDGNLAGCNPDFLVLPKRR